MLPTKKSHRTRVPEAKSLKPRLMSVTTGLTYRKYYNYTLSKLQHTKTDRFELCHKRKVH